MNKRLILYILWNNFRNFVTYGGSLFRPDAPNLTKNKIVIIYIESSLFFNLTTLQPLWQYCNRPTQIENTEKPDLKVSKRVQRAINLPEF